MCIKLLLINFVVTLDVKVHVNVCNSTKNVTSSKATYFISSGWERTPWLTIGTEIPDGSPYRPQDTITERTVVHTGTKSGLVGKHTSAP